MEIALAIGAVSLILGGLFGVVDDYTQIQEAKREKTHTEEQITNNAQDQLDLLNLNFELDKKNAIKESEKLTLQADVQAEQNRLLEKQTNLAEKNAGLDFNQNIDLMQLQADSDIFGFNTAAIQGGQSTGNALANTAASGIRAGSSLSDAIDMEAALNSQQLQLAENQTNAQMDINLNSLLNNLQNQRFGIANNRANILLNAKEISSIRNEASYWANAYNEGGDYYKINQQKIKNIENGRDRQLGDLQFKYDEFTREDNRIKRVLKDTFNIGGAFNNYGTSLFTMPDYSKANFNNL